MCGWCAPAEGDRHIFPLGFLRLRAGWLGWMLVGWGGKMSQSPGIMVDGRPLGLGCSRCASLGTRCLARSRGLGFRMCAGCAPVEGDRHIFPLGFFGWGLGGWVECWFDGAGK